jgi:hypothetical protein
VETTGAYLDLVSDFSKLVERKNVPQEYQILVDKVTVRGFPYIGTLRESTYRTTIVFGRDSQGMLMLTIWKYAKDRARMIMVDEFLNTSVLGCRATLSLSVVPGLDKSLWKTAWLSKDISYELYVTDRLSQSGRPSRSPSAIVALAELMAGVGAGC